MVIIFLCKKIFFYRVWVSFLELCNFRYVEMRRKKGAQPLRKYAGSFSERCEKRRPRHTRLITPCRTLRFVPVVELFLGWKAEKMHFHNRKRESPNLLLFQRQRPVLVSFAPCWFYQSINLDFSNLIPLMYMLHTSLERDLKDSEWIMMRSCQIMTS